MVEKKLIRIFEGTFIFLNIVTIGGGIWGIYNWSSTAFNESNYKNNTYQSSGSPAGVTSFVIHSLGVLSTNLDEKPQRLIRIEVNLEISNEATLKEIKTLRGVVQDSIIQILNGKSFQDIETIQGKLALKNQILIQVNRLLKRGGAVENMYFSQLIVQ